MFDGYFPMLRVDLYAMQRAMMTPRDFFFAQAIEAQRAETVKLGSVVDESAVPEGCAR